MKGQLRGEQGFTLVELLIAMTLLSIGIFGVVGMQAMALKSNSIANQVTVANALAQEVLEEILSRDASDPIFASNSSNNTYNKFPVYPITSPPSYSNSITDPDSGSYSATFDATVGTTSNGISNNMTKITVTVMHTYAGQTKRIILSGFKVTV